MANLIPGSVAYVKASEEPVFVVRTRPASTVEFVEGLSGQMVEVRRFHIDAYHTEAMLREELETSDEQHSRKFKEMNGLKAAFETGSIPETFSSN